MNSKAHAFHPNSDSFEDRVSELRTVLNDLARAKKSLSHTDERLGTQQEKLDAVSIYEITLTKALKSFNGKEISSIRNNKVLNEAEMSLLLSFQRISALRNHHASQTSNQRKI